MPAVVDQEKCNSCGTCIETCPNESIKLNDAGKAQVDQDSCIDCEMCKDACPENAISMA